LSKNGQKSSKIVKKRPKFAKIRKIQTKFEKFRFPRKKTMFGRRIIFRAVLRYL